MISGQLGSERPDQLKIDSISSPFPTGSYLEEFYKYKHILGKYGHFRKNTDRLMMLDGVVGGGLVPDH